MTDPLLSTTDFALFKAKDPAWFLGSIGDTIRDFCGWHIFPIMTVTGHKVRIGNKGIIMLPTMNLVSVEQITWCNTVLPSGAFEPHPEGWVQCIVPWYRHGSQDSYATVDFTHGYEAVPKAVAEVGFELTARTMEHPAGVVKHMTRGPVDLDFNEFGAVLSDDQKDRLGPYTLPRVR
jgi:hypothetical protein